MDGKAARVAVTAPSPKTSPRDLVCTCVYHGNHEDCRAVDQCWSNGSYTRTELACECSPWPFEEDDEE